MSFSSVAVAAAEGVQAVTELPIPAPGYGAIAAVLFIVLGLVTFSFRDVANRHQDKAEAYAREHGSQKH